MKGMDVLWIALILLLSFGITWFQYAKQIKTNTKRALVFAIPRALAYICLGLLFLNLEFTQTELIVEKPKLIIGVDNSTSITQLSDTIALKQKVSDLIENPDIKEAFDIHTFSFGEDFEQLKNLDFKDPQTNINSFLTEVTKIYREQSSPIVLFTDGQQTQGQDYSYNSKLNNRTIIPVIVGDTTNYTDLKIDRINANSYAFINNQFPVEVFLSYNGKSNVQSDFVLKSNGRILARKPVQFSDENKTQNFKIYTKASKLGVNTFEAELVPTSEKNTQNNTQKFAVEVIDERTKILMVYDNLHPDIGMFKKSIASNSQRQFALRSINEDLTDIASYNLVILYQPNTKFDKLFKTIQSQKVNYIAVCGTQTDYNFLNRIQSHFKKTISTTTEDYYALDNKSFGSYQPEDIDIKNFPPLKNIFGDIELLSEVDILYYQSISGFATEQPLLMTLTENQTKYAYIFGENTWRWRMKSHVNEGDFMRFDRFLDQLIQFTSSKETKKRLVSNVKSFYNQGENNTINVQYFDRNYVFDPNKKITLRLTDKKTSQIFSYGFVLKDSRYSVKINDLKGGDYNYKIEVEDENVSDNGQFKVIDFMIEKTFYRANKEKLEALSDTFFYEDNVLSLKAYLSSQQKFKPLQKRIEKKESLINWEMLLILIIVFLTIEWFSRKYFGLI